MHQVKVFSLNVQPELQNSCWARVLGGALLAFFPLWAGSTSGFVLLAWQRIKLVGSLLDIVLRDFGTQAVWTTQSWPLPLPSIMYLLKQILTVIVCPLFKQAQTFSGINFKQPECAREQEGLFVHYCKSWPKNRIFWLLVLLYVESSTFLTVVSVLFEQGAEQCCGQASCLLSHTSRNIIECIRRMYVYTYIYVEPKRFKKRIYIIMIFSHNLLTFNSSFYTGQHFIHTKPEGSIDLSYYCIRASLNNSLKHDTKPCKLHTIVFFPAKWCQSMQYQAWIFCQTSFNIKEFSLQLCRFIAKVKGTILGTVSKSKNPEKSLVSGDSYRISELCELVF